MKKLVATLIAIAGCFCATAQTHFYVHQKEKAYEFSVSETDSIDFVSPTNYENAMNLVDSLARLNSKCRSFITSIKLDSRNLY